MIFFLFTSVALSSGQVCAGAAADPVVEERWQYHGGFNLTLLLPGRDQTSTASASLEGDVTQFSLPSEGLEKIHTDMSKHADSVLKNAQSFREQINQSRYPCASLVRFSPIIRTDSGYDCHDLLGFYTQENGEIRLARVSAEEPAEQELVFLSGFLRERSATRIRNGRTEIAINDTSVEGVSGLNFPKPNSRGRVFAVKRSKFNAEEMHKNIEERWYKQDETRYLTRDTISEIRKRHDITVQYICEYFVRRATYFSLKEQYEEDVTNAHFCHLKDLFQDLVNLWKKISSDQILPISQENEELLDAVTKGLDGTNSSHMKRAVPEFFTRNYFAQDPKAVIEALLFQMPININKGVNDYCCAEQGKIFLILSQARMIRERLGECLALLMHLHATFTPCHHCITTLVRTFEERGFADLPLYIIFSADRHYDRPREMVPYTLTTSYAKHFFKTDGVSHHASDRFKLGKFEMRPFFVNYQDPIIPVILLKENEQKKCQRPGAWEPADNDD